MPPSFIDQASQRIGTNTDSSTVTVPASAQVGDLLILAAFWLGASAELSTPSGWVRDAAAARTGISTMLATRVATGSESEVTVTSTISQPSHLAVWVLRGVDGISDVNQNNQGSGNATFTFPTYSASAYKVPLHILLAASGTASALTVDSYATGMSGIGVDLPNAGQRTAAVLAAGTNWSEAAPGTAMTVSLTSYFGVAYTMALEVSGAPSQLDTPQTTLVSQTPTSGPGLSDGTATISWPAVSGATGYSAHRATNPNPVEGDFVQVAASVTSPYTFTGLGAGQYALGIRAKS